MYPRLLQLGHISIPTYGGLTALALVAGLTAAVYFARRLGLDPNKIWTLCLVGILTALVGARLLLVAVYFSVFREHPFWVLGLTIVHNEWVATLSAAAGVGAAMLYALAEGLPLLTTLDALAPCVALGVALNRVGAFLAGLDYGLPAALPWSVTYTSRIAAFWYRTPLGIALHPVQLYEAAASLLIFALLVWWLRRRSQAGEMAGAWLLLYGLASFFLSFYGAESGGWFAGAIEMAAVISGGAFWVQRGARAATAS